MGFTELLLIAIGLSMDAAAVSICKGLATEKVRIGNMLIAGLWFGSFQALMPLIGYLLGSGFSSMIESVDHWIAFVLLAFIGGNMIREALGSDEEGGESACYSPSAMLPLAIATSIDALAVGISFAFLSVDIIPAVLAIGACCLSACGDDDESIRLTPTDENQQPISSDYTLQLSPFSEGESYYIYGAETPFTIENSNKEVVEVIEGNSTLTFKPLLQGESIISIRISSCFSSVEKSIK